jgi:hypothetical protein
MATTIAFALAPGWWIVVAVAVVLVLALGSTLFGSRSPITPRRYRRPTSATPAPGSRGPAQLSGRDEVRQAWETHPPRRRKPPSDR